MIQRILMNGECPTLIGLRTVVMGADLTGADLTGTGLTVMILLFWIQPVNQRKISIKTHSGI
jgi:hypothetical protein